ncbi:MAG: hypothetical protein ACXVK4_17895 [Acidimicrobiia bacterium]
MRRFLVLAVAGGLLLSACGGGGSDAASTTTTSKSPGTAIDRRIARAALLLVADAPGYQQVSPQQSEIADLAGASSGISACDFYRTSNQHRVLTGRSVALQRGSTTVNLSVAVFADAATAGALVAQFRDPRMVDCLRKIYAPKNVAVTVSPIPADGLGDDRVAYRITLSDQPGTAPTKVVDIVVVRVGRAVISANITGSSTDSAELQSTALPKVVDRLRAAGA